MSGRVGGCVRWGGVALILAVGVSPFLASSEAGASNAPPGPAGAPTAPIASGVLTKPQPWCGVGTCRRVAPEDGGACVAAPPVSANDGWLSVIDPITHSWDANCDGKLEKEVVADASVYATGCVSELPKATPQGPRCETAPVGPKGCGAHWALFPCELNKATGKCEATNLKGNVKQRCK